MIGIEAIINAITRIKIRNFLIRFITLQLSNIPNKDKYPIDKIICSIAKVAPTFNNLLKPKFCTS